MLLKRILMAAADETGKSLVPPAPAPAPTTTPQAQGDASADLDRRIAEAVAKAKTDERNSVFADLRRNGHLKKSAIAAIDGTNEAPGTTPAAPAAPDLSALRSFDRQLTRLGFADSLSDAQYQRAEKAFLEEKPGNAEAWLKDYFAGFGAATSANKSTTNAPLKPTNERPASDAGSPAGPSRPINEIDLLTASQQDIEHVIKQKGPHGLKAMLTEQLKGRRLKVSPE